MTTDIHKAPSVARKALTSTDGATPVARYDLSTSEGGRRYIADFFATELRRHDFTDYISTRLAADFACALAQHLAATGKHQAGEVQGDAHVVVLREMRARLTDAGSPARTAALDAAIAALAARQPGAPNGKLVGWWNGITPGYDGQGDWSIRWGADAENSRHDIPLYDGFNPIHYQQPAHGIALGRLRSQVLGLTRRVEPISGQRFSYVQLDDVLALIDQRDAAPGVDRG